MLVLNRMPPSEPVALFGIYRERIRRGLVICAEADRVDYPLHPSFPPEWGCLSVVSVGDGREEYRLSDRTLVVDDDLYLVLDPDSRYSYRLRSAGRARCLMVSFPPWMVASVARVVASDEDDALEPTDAVADELPRFGEHLARHDDFVTPELRRIERACRDGVSSPAWYHEHAAVLLMRLIQSRQRALAKLDASRRSTRLELARRVALATDRIHQDYRHPLDLRTLAMTAGLSPFHLLRVFRRIHGVTPQEFLQRQRAHVARRLLAKKTLSATRVARLVGFRSRASLYRWMRRLAARD